MAKKRGNLQGSLYKRNGRGAWIAAWHDHDGNRLVHPTRTTDRDAALRILAKRVADSALRREGVIDARVETVVRQSRRPIAEHLTDWETTLEAKRNSPRRVKLALQRVRRVIKECGFTTLAEVEPAKVSGFSRTLQEGGTAPRTVNAYRKCSGSSSGGPSALAGWRRTRSAEWARCV